MRAEELESEVCDAAMEAQEIGRRLESVQTQIENWKEVFWSLYEAQQGVESAALEVSADLAESRLREKGVELQELLRKKEALKEECEQIRGIVTQSIEQSAKALSRIRGMELGGETGAIERSLQDDIEQKQRLIQGLASAEAELERKEG